MSLWNDILGLRRFYGILRVYWYAGHFDVFRCAASLLFVGRGAGERKGSWQEDNANDVNAL